MKHFVEPLSVLCHDTLLGTSRIEQTAQKLAEPSSSSFRDSLCARLEYSASKNSQGGRRAFTIPDLISSVDTARSDFRTRAHGVKVGFRLLLEVQDWMKAQGYKPFASTPLTVTEMMEMTMRGQMKKEIKWIGNLVRFVGFIRAYQVFFLRPFSLVDIIY